MKFKFILSLTFLFTLFSCNSQSATNIKTVEVPAFEKEIQSSQKPQILDVRTPAEFAEGHIDNAQNIDWLGDQFIPEAKKLDKNKPVYVYCKSGKRSLKASEKLEELGFKKIYNLDGGYLKWKTESKTAK